MYTHNGKKRFGTPGHSSPGTALPFLPDLPPLVVNYFAHWRRYSPPPPSLLPQNFETGGLSNTTHHRDFCMVIVITADPTLLETMDRAHSGCTTV